MERDMTRGQIIKQANIRKYGSEEAYRQHLREVASKGGSAKVKKGFACMEHDRVIELASKGGKARNERPSTNL